MGGERVGEKGVKVQVQNFIARAEIPFERKLHHVISKDKILDQTRGIGVWQGRFVRMIDVCEASARVTIEAAKYCFKSLVNSLDCYVKMALTTGHYFEFQNFTVSPEKNYEVLKDQSEGLKNSFWAVFNPRRTYEDAIEKLEDHEARALTWGTPYQGRSTLSFWQTNYTAPFQAEARPAHAS